MNFLSAEVEIKVDDSKLSSQLARAKSMVVKTVSKIGSSFKKMAMSFKAAFDKMVRYAKWGALAIAGAFTLVTRAAMKQEDAVFLLSAALRISGEYTKELETRFRAFAASIQQATIYGDEEVLALMQLQKSLGVTSDKLEEAAKMSIGLATATGRDVKSMAMYIALAQQGEFTMLRRYIPALRSTTDKTEQLRIITEFAAKGFALAEERAKTTSGVLRQMWNAIGDVAEVIGGAFLPGIRDTAKAMKEWAERNQERIRRWAETAAAYIGFAKDVFVDFIKYLNKDWKAGINVAFKVVLELAKGFINSLVVIVKEGAALAGRAFADSFARTVAKGIAGVIQKIDMLVMGEKYGEWARKTGAIKPEHFKAKPVGAAPGMSRELKQISEATMRNVKSIMKEGGVSISESTNKLKNRLEEIKTGFEEIKTVTEEMQEPMKKALVEPVENHSFALDEAKKKMKEWASSAKDIWNRIAEASTRALDGMSDTLANLVVKGKADFNALAESIMMDMARITAKGLMARTLGAFLPSLFGAASGAGAGMGTAPTLQHGGEVKKTGLAVVHEGERFSGTEGEVETRRSSVTFNMNVSAIDAAGTYQFLDRNKKTIATMLQTTMDGNHPLRRNKGWK